MLKYNPLFVYGEENLFALSFQMTSTPLLAHRRLQLSIALHKIDAIDLMQEAPTVIFPILWIDEVCAFLTLHAAVSVLTAHSLSGHYAESNSRNLSFCNVPLSCHSVLQ
jgi:hypothetical protein